MGALKYIVGLGVGFAAIIGIVAMAKAAKAQEQPPSTPPATPPAGSVKVWSSPEVCFGEGSGCSKSYTWIAEPSVSSSRIRFQALSPGRDITFTYVEIYHSGGVYKFNPYIQNSNLPCYYGSPVMLDMPFMTGIYKIRIDGYVHRETHPRGMGIVELFS